MSNRLKGFQIKPREEKALAVANINTELVALLASGFGQLPHEELRAMAATFKLVAAASQKENDELRALNNDLIATNEMLLDDAKRLSEDHIKIEQAISRAASEVDIPFTTKQAAYMRLMILGMSQEILEKAKPIFAGRTARLKHVEEKIFVQAEWYRARQLGQETKKAFSERMSTLLKNDPRFHNPQTRRGATISVKQINEVWLKGK